MKEYTFFFVKGRKFREFYSGYVDFSVDIPPKKGVDIIAQLMMRFDDASDMRWMFWDLHETLVELLLKESSNE